MLFMHGLLGSYDAARGNFDEVISKNPSYLHAHLWKGKSLLADKKYAEAATEFGKAGQRNWGAQAGLALCKVRLNDRKAAEMILETMKAVRVGASSKPTPFDFARVYLALGRINDMRKSLDEACKYHISDMLYIAVDPLFKDVKGIDDIRDRVKRGGW